MPLFDTDARVMRPVGIFCDGALLPRLFGFFDGGLDSPPVCRFGFFRGGWDVLPVCRFRGGLDGLPVGRFGVLVSSDDVSFVRTTLKCKSN